MKKGLCYPAYEAGIQCIQWAMRASPLGRVECFAKVSSPIEFRLLMLEARERKGRWTEDMQGLSNTKCSRRLRKCTAAPKAKEKHGGGVCSAAQMAAMTHRHDCAVECHTVSY